ncbi:MAG TPA: transcriptional repressor [Candidatus Baltobacteraceae bacterium]|nr:transcriptional repressor [Candidatus Baltobacteraceae bacterium]
MHPLERHYRTKPREQILDLLRRERRYLTAATVARLLATVGVRIALSTVYRTLDLLESMGVVSRRNEATGEAAYIACLGEQHHHHAICRLCGHVDEVDCAAVEPFDRVLQDKFAFTLDAHTIEFYGKCVRCA